MPNPTQPVSIAPSMTMEEIIRIAPSAQRALFQRYHVGGCSSCGFQPSDTLAQVCKERNILDVNEVIHTIQTAHELDGKLEVDPLEVKGWLDSGEDFSFIDVRTPQEWAISRIAAAELLDYQDPSKYMGLPKDRKLVFSCHSGVRSLDVAAYFRGHGFTQVFSMRGGIEGWRTKIDPSLPSY